MANGGSLTQIPLGFLFSRDISAEQKDLTSILLGLFKSPSEEIKHAAAFCLGNLAVGNLDKYVPSMVNEIKDKGKINFLVLVALKEVSLNVMDGIRARC